jgi:hypothetical protein
MTMMVTTMATMATGDDDNDVAARQDTMTTMVATGDNGMTTMTKATTMARR